MVGWYQNLDRTGFGCYYGGKVLQDEGAAKVRVPTAAVQAQARGHLRKKATETPYDKPLDHKTQKSVVSKLNRKIGFMQLGWKAREMPKWNGRTMREVNAYAGIRRKEQTRALHRQMLQQHAQDPAARAKSF